MQAPDGGPELGTVIRSAAAHNFDLDTSTALLFQIELRIEWNKACQFRVHGAGGLAMASDARSFHPTLTRSHRCSRAGP